MAELNVGDPAQERSSFGVIANNDSTLGTDMACRNSGTEPAREPASEPTVSNGMSSCHHPPIPAMHELNSGSRVLANIWARTPLTTASVDLRAQLTGVTADLKVLRSLSTERGSAVEMELSQHLKRREIAACRALAHKCLFVIGFARSNTTITQNIINSATNSMILGEANFPVHDLGKTFSVAYNQQHRAFSNQVTKSTYAPDFFLGAEHTWWQWLETAAEFYDLVGEKIALSYYHFDKLSPAELRSFYEARFLKARYIFMLRNPIDVLLSCAKMFGVADDAGMTRLCRAWLDFMELWADAIRIFPRRTTLVVENFEQEAVGKLSEFTGLELCAAQMFIHPQGRRRHDLSNQFPTLVRLRPHMEEVYGEALAALNDSPALWQAEEKRESVEPNASSERQSWVDGKSRPLGRVWLGIQRLRNELLQG